MIILAYQYGTVYDTTMTARRHASDIRPEPGTGRAGKDQKIQLCLAMETGYQTGEEPITAVLLSNLRG
ncbi:hypothetical protein B1Q49_003518 [Salmonella enterica]|nr:hypothetical protein [Salmonella enterica]